MKRQPAKGVIGPSAQGGYFWRRVLWSLVFPSARSHRVAVTVPGAVLMVLSFGVGTAAYNSANNILFITLSLLLGCLVLSGVLSWLNFRGLEWRLEVEAPLRAGREHAATVVLGNVKRWLPSHGLVLAVRNSSATEPRELVLRDRLEPRGETPLSWTFCPVRRGVERVELAHVGSLFPFGFLRKGMATKTACEVLVWPALVEYRRFPVAAWRRAQPGRPVARVGQSGDLLAMRAYREGDSHRQIHWKASARLQRLVVRQFSADTEEGFTLWLTTTSEQWKRVEQFELLCSFAATLAEDLFRQGKLEAVAIDDGPVAMVRGVRDVEAFLDALARLQPGQMERPVSSPAKRNMLTFAPEGSRGIAAYVDGEKAVAT